MKRLPILMITILLVVAFGGSALAWSPQIEGKPDRFDPGDSRGYFIWHDRNGMHMWTTTRGQQHVFSGVIRTDGRFISVDGERNERGDKYRIDRDRNQIQFRYITDGGVDGLNFRIAGGSYVHFDLYMDGHKIGRKEIFLGDRGWHPRHSEFTLYR